MLTPRRANRVDNRGKRLTGCLTCNLWAVEGEGWTRLSEEDLRALHQLRHGGTIGRRRQQGKEAPLPWGAAGLLRFPVSAGNLGQEMRTCPKQTIARHAKSSRTHWEIRLKPKSGPIK